MNMITPLILFPAVLFFMVFLMKNKLKYWKRKNVFTGKVIPFFGDTYDVIMSRISVAEMTLNIHNKVPSNHRYVGAYFFHVPVLFIRTPEMIKQICVKNWEHFENHGNLTLNSSDQLWQKAIFPLKGQEWKEARRVTAPISNGYKVISLFPILVRHARKLVKFIKDKEEEVVEIESRDCLIRVINDISWDVSIGLEIDSLNDPDNPYFNIGLKTIDLTTPYKKLVLFLYTVCGSIAKFFKMSLFGKGQALFLNAVKETIRKREEKGIKRSDLIGVLMETRDEQIKQNGEDGKQTEVLTPEIMASYVFVLYLASTDTITTVITFLTWELAMAPEIQLKLRQECDNVPAGNDEATFEDINNMVYMDMVIHEALRKWPGGISSDRVVTKPYTIQPELPHEKPVHLDVGDNILLPIFAIHRDPRNYEDPNKFDPDRWSSENKHKLNPYAFLPFGAGPRFCVGSRLSVLIMKVIVYHLLRSFEIVTVDKTPKTLILDKKSVNLEPESHLYLGLKSRE